MREGRVCAGLVQDVDGAVRVVERVRDRRAVGVDLPGLSVGVVVAEGRRLAVGVGRGGQPTDRVVGVAPTSGSRQRHPRPPVSVVVGVADRAVGRDDLRRSIGVVVGVSRAPGGVAHRRLAPRRVVGEARGGQVGIGDSDESPGVVIRVGDRLPLLIRVRRERSRRVVNPAFGRAVGVGRAGLLVSRGIGEGVRVPCDIGGGGIRGRGD